MLKVDKLILGAASRLSPLTFDPKRCSRLCSPLGTCSRCRDVCPVEGIRFTETAIERTEACLDCGLCAGACPTRAFSLQEPTEESLYDALKNMNAGTAPVITCKKNPYAARADHQVPCLGSMSRALLVALDVLPAEVTLLFSEETCSSCEVQGIPILQDALNQVKVLEEKADLAGGRIRCAEIPPQRHFSHIQTGEAVDDSRRAFLTSLFGAVRNLPEQAIDYLMDPHGEKTYHKGASSDGYFLKAALKGVQGNDRELKGFSKPAGTGACQFCTACETLCPSGALRIREKGLERYLTLDQLSCTGCGLCKTVCGADALELVPKRTGDYHLVSPEVLMEGREKECSGCGELIHGTSQVTLCPSCEAKNKQGMNLY